MFDLSIIIVSYNTSDLTRQCLGSITKSLQNHPVESEIIVVDNASTDSSVSELSKNKKIFLIKNKSNVGFGKANNIGLKKASGKYILFLNSDTKVDDLDISEMYRYLERNSEVGVMTAKVLLEDGSLDPASHRGFPTVWRSFTYFLKLEQVTKHIPVLNRMFGGYHLTHLDHDVVHEIESPSGAFFLTRKSILDEVGGFDEKFFMYGEDLDLAKRIKEKGYKVMFYPIQSIVHLKGKSGMEHESRQLKVETRKHFYDAMRIFYNKHYAHRNPKITSTVVNWFINFKSPDAKSGFRH